MDDTLKDLLSVVTKGAKFEECESSNIEAYGYNQNTRSIWILFKGRKLYEYLNRNKSLYKELQAAKSKGSWVNANLVKPKVNFYKYIL